MRLRDLGLSIGRLPTGRDNAIGDVEGLRVGHADIDSEGLVSGVTAVIPYTGRARRTFIGRFSVDGGDAFTGLGVTEDFGAMSTAVVLAPSAAVGRVYDGVIAHGLGIDSGLSEDAGWPPVVVGIDDSAVNAAATTHEAIKRSHLQGALSAAGRFVTEGSVGIGRGLAAFGYRGGIGTSSRVDNGYTVGALVAANGGVPARLAVDGWPTQLDEVDADTAYPSTPVSAEVPGEVADAFAHAARNFAAVIATDAPLAPRQLGHLAGRAAYGLVRVGLLDEFTREGVLLALSTTAWSADKQAADGTVTVRTLGDAYLPPLFAAAADACEEAVLNGLLEARDLPPSAAPGSAPLRQRRLAALPATALESVRRQHAGRPARQNQRQKRP